MRGRFRRHRTDVQEMNITAFMNLMVILVPFLLITAVFSRLTILELNLPAGSSGQVDPNQLQLEVTIRADVLEVGERSRGVIRRIEAGARGHDYKTLSQVLQQVKERFPDKTQATILSEPNTPYDILVQLMDTVRVVSSVQGGSVTRYELFPDVSIGDAPGRASVAEAKTPPAAPARKRK
jgi:biopolymer transport protein ExbD